ncbi:MAG: hypothetical protein PHJ00_00410 [Candidatus Omnitrophica bacterium]|nr:hypothetical protein [Candidatus Omnitrophota bacterium]
MRGCNKYWFQIRILLFCILVALLPFAEWKFIGLPIKGRPIVIDLNSYLSASVFDIVFVFFAISCVPLIWRAYKKKLLFDWHLFCWGICAILAVILFFQQRVKLPYLTPTIVNVIDVRSLIIHSAVAVCVALMAIQIPFSRIVRGAQIFYSITVLGVTVLCYFALLAFQFFLFNYPFKTPSSISFPFPSQNYAAIFLTLCCIGCIGIALTRGTKILLLMGPPIFLLAAALTGSRSSMFVCTIIILAYVVIYTIYYFRIALSLITKNLPLNPIILLVSLCIGYSLIYFNSGWTPIARSMSIFQDLWTNHINLVAGGERGSPRYEFWSKALKSYGINEPREKDNNTSFSTHRFSVGLIGITEGCKTISNTIPDLTMGIPYYVRLILTPKANDNNLAVLEIFKDTHRKQLIGSIGMTLNSSRELSNVYYFIADTNSNFVFLNADLSAFTINNGKEINNNCLNHQSVYLFEEPFNGAAKPSISLTDNHIKINADSMRLRGYISDTANNYNKKNTLILEYTVNIKSHRILSLEESPLVFYAGLSDNTDVDQNKKKWKFIRNGLLIRHEVAVTEFQTEIALKNQEAKFIYWSARISNEMPYGANPIKLFNHEVRCGNKGQNLISRLWEPVLTEDTVVSKIPRSDLYRIKTENKSDIKSTISVNDPRILFTVDRTFTNRGSLHNVYLDWLYYVGPIPFVLFLFFIFSLLIAFANFTWVSRFSSEFPFILSVFCQLLVIAILMYAHPYVFLKYIWFVFGIATAVMIHPDFKKIS